VFVVLTGYLTLGERVDSSGLAGVLLVVCGSWLLNLKHAEIANWRTWAAPLAAIAYEPGSRMMLGVALLYSLTSTMSKGAMQYMAPQHFGAFYFVLLGATTVLLFSAQRPSMAVRIWRRPLAVLVVGLSTGVMVYTHFLALQQVEVAYMIAVKRTSLLFGIVYGALLFRERGLGTHLLGGSLMLAGVLVIALGG
jgi:drug/metabolite transporter (DMT)-like permease